MDKNYSWSFLGFLLAAILGFLNFYQYYYDQDQPDLSYVITSRSSVLEIKENIENLNVVYNNESLSKSKNDLTIISFKITNSGNAAIIPSHYDDDFPLGFKVSGGVLAVDPIITEYSNDYLKEKLTITRNKSNNPIFPNAILEPNDYFKLKVILLHKIGSTPHIMPIGKIVNVKSIRITNYKDNNVEQSKWNHIFSGSGAIQVSRLIAYGFVFLALLVAYGLSSEALRDWMKKRIRIKSVSAYEHYHASPLNSDEAFIRKKYIENEHFDIILTLQIMHSISKHNCFPPPNSDKSYDSKIDELEGKVFSELKSQNLISSDDEKLIVASDTISRVTAFIKYLEKHDCKFIVTPAIRNIQAPTSAFDQSADKKWA